MWRGIANDLQYDAGVYIKLQQPMENLTSNYVAGDLLWECTEPQISRTSDVVSLGEQVTSLCLYTKLSLHGQIQSKPQHSSYETEWRIIVLQKCILSKF